MIDFEISDKHRQMRDMIRMFATTVIRPMSLEADRTGRIPDEFLIKLAQMRGAFQSAIQQALDSTWVTGIDSTLEGDGETLEFTLPTGVFDLQKIYTEDTAVAHGPKYISNHWKETATGVVRFDYGYAPRDGETIHIHYRSRHADLADYSTVISNEINLEWLKYKAAYELLYNFGMPTYGPAPEYRIEERINKVMNASKLLTPRMIPDIRIQTAG